MKLVCAGAAVIVGLACGAKAAQIRPAVPVMVGGADGSEGCAGTATLAIRAGSRINLRAGPGMSHPVIARLSSPHTVSICQRRDGWVGILVLPRTRPYDCGESDAGPKPTPYAGPCVSGWISAKYVRFLAG